MALRCEVEDGTRAVRRQQLRHQGLIPDITLNQCVAGVILNRGQIVSIARIGQFIEIYDGFGRRFKPI